ncbi:hypothetical protein [Bordetella sp. N]|uniref:hypothetical protein n=1 Tax=Bordetella sp. N TaxID=1746199 RepID=UPI00070B8B38|nr:hypothetical protein [Bordetella sp. N]ALM84696.1 hypothetical protein ASB57_18460 [Bordetella sp. N]
MTAGAKEPATVAAVALLDPPKLHVDVGYAITDQILAGQSSLPVEIPFYSNNSPGDLISLFLNGHVVYYQTYNQGDSFPLILPVSVQSFNFTGRANFYYKVNGVKFPLNSQNSNTSSHGAYRVYRTGYDDPDSNNNSVYPPPVVKPALFNAATLKANGTVDVTVDLTQFPPDKQPKAGDELGIYFELVATTANAPLNPTFYPLTDGTDPDGFRRPLADKQTTFTLSVPAVQLGKIDGNNGVVYYSHFVAGYDEYQSRRAPVIIDTVSPFSAP